MPESLGKTLKRIRESKHLSAEEVSERSRIPKHIISALEEDRLDEIKSVFYAKSFVKTYAAFLGALDEPNVKEYLVKPAPKPQKKPEMVSTKPDYQPNKIPQMDFSVIAKYRKHVLAVVIGILAFWALSFAVGQAAKSIKSVFAKRQSKAVKSAPARQSAKAPVKAEKEKPKDAVKEVKKEAPAEQPDSLELEVSASDNTWLRVIGDGELMFTGSFKKGGKDTWKAKKEIKLEVGNAGVIKISVNGKPSSFSGKKGEKKEIIITRDGIK